MEITGTYRRITRWRLLGRIGGLLDGISLDCCGTADMTVQLSVE